METYEHLRYRARQTRVHREAIARPIDRGTQPAELLRDGAAGLPLPLPDPLDELFTTEVGALLALGVELPLDQHLCGNAGVVHARLPERGLAAHAVVARERIHDRVLERVPHV